MVTRRLLTALWLIPFTIGLCWWVGQLDANPCAHDPATVVGARCGQ